MIMESISKVVEGNDLSREEARETFDEIMKGEATPAQIACLITALRMKGETVDEITGAAESMRDVVAEVMPNVKGELLDVVGTGGDKKNTFNISTASAIVAAGAGCYVAKHGNRAVSSGSGAADVLEKLGVKIDCNNEKNAELIEKVGIAFLFAPCHHPAMRHAIGPRKEIGIRTIFNILGPITNPANAKTFLLGVYDLELAEKLANVLANMGLKKALVVHGNDGCDEISISDPTTIFEVENGKVKKSEISPQDFGLERAKPEEITVKSIEESANAIQGVLSGEEKGAKRNTVLLNAGAAIYANGKAGSIKEGIELAKES
ncbi:MAG: anthranilate phosphoribosyltransferase, partial [Candidatus Diapherotrites archaeon]